MIQQAVGDAVLADWQHVHNTVIPTDPLSLDQVRERSGRYHLELAVLDGVVVGCSTVRPPSPEEPAATVIARILPEYRRRGFGSRLYRSGLARAQGFGAPAIETIVLACNTDGLRFAEAHGFVEVERYLLDGDTIPFVTLRLS
ncbi:GNAT family N-acetyltransferase [Kitasatospora sp. RB6PN24]|uniref:GNAT family N-acetyltransferase n=1 Tax=Kitasatospora humi TaxID=2893891 RepID=UPI001E285A44|nr:GNAT family N-acetyltransferase [Kitasatospora humi]MCC9306592.1 GNAT family N-acetyltransferase [Kitasatospora humi]